MPCAHFDRLFGDSLSGFGIAIGRSSFRERRTALELDTRGDSWPYCADEDAGPGLSRHYEMGLLTFDYRSSPRAAATAFSTACALLMASRYSVAGLESATMPAPACR